LLNESADGTVGIEKMKEIQLDVKSSCAEALTPYLIEALENYDDKSSKMKDALTELKNWDFEMDKDIAAPAIYRKWRDRMEQYTFEDEWDEYDVGPYPGISILEKLMENDTSLWFDDIDSSEIETRDDIIIKAIKKAIKELDEFFDTDEVSEWRWGDIHKGKFSHIAGLDSLSVGPVELDGSGYTVTPSGVGMGNLSSIRYAGGGASERMIVDLSDMDNCYSVIPSGQRGISNSKHYSDQLEELFLEGKYHKQYFYDEAKDYPDAYVESTLIFLPGQNPMIMIVLISGFVIGGITAGIAIIFLRKKRLNKIPDKSLITKNEENIKE